MTPSICFAWVLFSLCAHGQELQLWLSTSFDQPSGSAFAFAQTLTDYATGYYYSVCTSAIAYTEDDDGDYDYDWASSAVCDPTNAAVYWYFTVPTTTDWIGFSGYHYESIDYYVYQFDDYCDGDGYDCYDYWDAFEMGLIGINGGTYDSGTSWDLPGLPAYGSDLASFEEYTMQTQGTRCIYPTAESTTYSLEENTSGGFYGAGFKMTLTVPGSADVSGRKAQETLSNIS